MLGDILTARPEQKRNNAEAEIRLQRYAEPTRSVPQYLRGAATVRHVAIVDELDLSVAQPTDQILVLINPTPWGR